MFLSVAPGAAGDQHQHREDLQSSRQHIQDQNDLGKIAEAGEVAGGTNGFQTWADVVKTGQYRGEIGSGGEVVQTDQQEADDDNDYIGSQIGIGVVQDPLLDRLTVAADNLNLSGMQDLADIPPQALKDQQHPGYFDAAAGGAGAGTHHHQAQQDRLGEAGPQIKVCSGKACRRDDTGHLEKGVAESFFSPGEGTPKIDGNEDYADGDDPQIQSQLLVLEHTPELPQ